ncbi:MAG: hypothetical protein V1916_01880, partial [Patescibacteria group bacterium]
YEAIIKGEPIRRLNIPESFNVLVRELKGLCLDVELLGSEEVRDDDEPVRPRDRQREPAPVEQSPQSDKNK